MLLLNVVVGVSALLYSGCVSRRHFPKPDRQGRLSLPNHTSCFTSASIMRGRS